MEPTLVSITKVPAKKPSIPGVEVKYIKQPTAKRLYDQENGMNGKHDSDDNDNYMVQVNVYANSDGPDKKYKFEPTADPTIFVPTVDPTRYPTPFPTAFTPTTMLPTNDYDR